MEKYLIFVLIIVVSSCNSITKENRTPEAIKFEKILGKQKSKELTVLITSFEQLLEENYNTHNSEEALKAYINDINKSGEFGLIYNEDKKQMSKNLRDEIWLKPDSCFIDENFIICNYSYKNISFKVRNAFTDKPSQSSSVSENIIFNKRGLYFYGLKKVANKDMLVADYINNLEISGVISPSFLVGMLSAPKVDFSNYFIKRIIYIDIYMQNYKW